MDTKREVKLLVMASGVREGRGDTRTWDLDQKSGTWDEKRISEPAKVESSSANFSMDQVIYMFLSKPDIIIHLPFTMHLKTKFLKAIDFEVQDMAVIDSAQRVPKPDPIPGISFDTRPDPIQF